MHVMVQKMVVDEVCQIFGVGVEFLSPSTDPCGTLQSTVRGRDVDL